MTVSKGTIQERAHRELVKTIAVKGHRVTPPKCLTGENWSGTCSACGKTVLVRFDVPCGWLVVGTGVMSACHVSGRGF